MGEKKAMDTTRIILKIHSPKMGWIERWYNIKSAELSPDAEKKAIMNGLTELAENVEMMLRHTPEPGEGEIVLNGKILKLPPWDERCRQERAKVAELAAGMKNAESLIDVRRVTGRVR